MLILRLTKQKLNLSLNNQNYSIFVNNLIKLYLCKDAVSASIR